MAERLCSVCRRTVLDCQKTRGRIDQITLVTVVTMLGLIWWAILTS